MDIYDEEPKIINVSAAKEVIKLRNKPRPIKLAREKTDKISAFLESRNSKFIFISVFFIFALSLYLLYLSNFFLEEEPDLKNQVSEIDKQSPDPISLSEEYYGWEIAHWGGVNFYFPAEFKFIRGGFDSNHFSMVKRVGGDYLSYLQITGDIRTSDGDINLSVNKSIATKTNLYEKLDIREKNIYTNASATLEYIGTFPDTSIRYYLYEFLYSTPRQLYTFVLVTPEVTWIREKDEIEKIKNGIIVN